MSGIKKSPLISVPFLKKRLRRISALGFHNLTVNEFNFTVHFTLHQNEKTVAFYTSEPIENQRSPEWSYFKFPSQVQCLREFILRVWITSSNISRLFLEYDMQLDNLLKPDEQKNNVTKGNNCLWIEMFGYRFTDNEDEINNQSSEDEILFSEKKIRSVSNKSYNKLSIIRMNSVVNAIDVEKQSSSTYLEKLQTFVDEHEDFLSKRKERELRKLRIDNLKQYLKYRTFIIQQRLIIHQQKQKAIEERKNQLNFNLTQLSEQFEKVNLCNDALNQSKIVLRTLTQMILFRQKEIINEIYSFIYPIECNEKDEYSIANLKLPQADDKIYQTPLDRGQNHQIAAAIGYCSHFVVIISQIIHLPLRFPIDYHGISTIKIYDFSFDQNEFPLYPTTNLNAFRYGFYLLNRNIGQIMYHCRIVDRRIDYRNTLENLKQLIEQYFINQIQYYPSLQTVENSDEQTIRNQRNSTDSSLFSSSVSSTTSFIENNDDDQIGDLDLFPKLNIIKPRLVMQVSRQLPN